MSPRRRLDARLLQTTRPVRAAFGAALTVVGLAATVAGVILMLDNGSQPAAPLAAAGTTTTVASAKPAEDATTTTTEAVATTLAPTTTAATTTTVAAETPQAFLAAFVDAFRTGNVDFLLGRLDERVFGRYDRELCRATLASLSNPDFDLQHREHAEKPSWDWITDGLTETISGVTAIEVDRTDGGQTIVQEIHVVLTDGTYRWFTDCGTPRS